MHLNTLEKFAMNNGIRDWIFRHIEAPVFKELGGDIEGMEVLEIGCGSGIGTSVILDRFKARQVVATDFDPDMVRRAQKRLSRFGPDRLTLNVADVTALEAKDGSFDAVVDFAAIHHISDWPLAIKEIYRVLRPDGVFLFEEVARQWIERWPWRVVFDHPKENRFSAQEFITALEEEGLIVGSNYRKKQRGDFIFGIGRKR